MKHEYWFTKRSPYEGSTPYYKVEGVSSWKELVEYLESLDQKLQESLHPVQYNGQYALYGKLEEYTG